MRFFLNINFIHTGKRNEAVWLSSGTLIFFYLFCRSFWLGDIFRSYFFKSPTQFLLMKMKMLIQKKRKKITNQFQSLFILILFLKLKRFFAIEILKLKKIIILTNETRKTSFCRKKYPFLCHWIFSKILLKTCVKKNKQIN